MRRVSTAADFPLSQRTSGRCNFDSGSNSRSFDDRSNEINSQPLWCRHTICQQCNWLVLMDDRQIEATIVIPIENCRATTRSMMIKIWATVHTDLPVPFSSLIHEHLRGLKIRTVQPVISNMSIDDVQIRPPIAVKISEACPEANPRNASHRTVPNNSAQ